MDRIEDASRKVTDDGYVFSVTLSNKDKVPAMMLRLKAVDKATGDLILPVLYSDNYFFLMPGESKTVTVKVGKEDCAGKPYITLRGFNVPETALAARHRKNAAWADPYAKALVENDWILGKDKPLRFEVKDVGQKAVELSVQLATDKGEPVGEWKRVVSKDGIVPFTFDLPDYFQVAEWPGNEILAAAKRLGIHEEALYRTLSYVDVKNFTDRIHCPVLMGFGLQDDTCPPHTNFAGYNNIPADTDKAWICFPLSGHHVEREPGWNKARDEFFARYDR